MKRGRLLQLLAMRSSRNAHPTRPRTSVQERESRDCAGNISAVAKPPIDNDFEEEKHAGSSFPTPQTPSLDPQAVFQAGESREAAERDRAGSQEKQASTSTTEREDQDKSAGKVASRNRDAPFMSCRAFMRGGHTWHPLSRRRLLGVGG